MRTVPTSDEAGTPKPDGIHMPVRNARRQISPNHDEQAWHTLAAWAAGGAEAGGPGGGGAAARAGLLRWSGCRHTGV